MVVQLKERLKGVVGERLDGPKKLAAGTVDYGKDRVGFAIRELLDQNEDVFVDPGKPRERDVQGMCQMVRMDMRKTGRVRKVIGEVEKDPEAIITAMAETEGLNTSFSSERRREIMELYFAHFHRMQAWIKQNKARRQGKEKPLSPLDVAKNQWANHAPSAPIHFSYDEGDIQYERQREQLLRDGTEFEETRGPDGKIQLVVKGARIMAAFFKSMCPFPCTYCTLPGANDRVKQYEKRFGKIKWWQQFHAFLDALNTREYQKYKQPVIEILNDGSWYSDTEIPPIVREKIMNFLSRVGHVHCVAIETRPDYILREKNGISGVDKIEEDLDRLRPNQKLKIYVGLESTDDLTAVVTRKHYGWDEFVASVEAIAGLLEHRPELKGRVSISVYNIMKQWYMTDREAIEETVKLNQEIAALSEKTGIMMETKTEPTIISRGTAQDYAYHQIGEDGERLYKNLNYFSVAESVARLAEVGLADRIAYGQRDDIDEIENISVVPGLDGGVSDLDFIVYNSVQQFQSHRDIRRFALEILPAIYGRDGQPTEEFKAWEAEVYGEASALKRLVDQYSGASLSHDESEMRERDRKVVELVSSLRNQPVDTGGLQRIGVKARLSAHLEESFGSTEAFGVSFSHVENVIPIDPSKRDCGRVGSAEKETAGYQVEVVLMQSNKVPMNVWFFIPAA